MSVRLVRNLERGGASSYTGNVPFATPSFETKIYALEELTQRTAALSRPLVFTNGVFDILHRGHVTYLAQARTLGAGLLVAVNSDASVRKLSKGPDRPINTLADRMAVLAALEAVTLVTWFEEDTPLALINRIKPDVLVKGGDWSISQIVGGTEVKSWGGVVQSIPFAHQHSTTATLAKARRS